MAPIFKGGFTNFPKLLQIARQASLLSDHHTFKVGAVVFDRSGRVVSTGFNHLKKTHPLLRRFHSDRTMHAEADAILSCPQRYKKGMAGLFLLVYRQHKDGRLANAYPCDMCRQIMKLFGIKTFYFTTDTGVLKGVL